MNNSSKNIGVPFSEKMSNSKRIKENMMKRPPKKIIEEAVKKSTGITESRQVAELVDNVMKAESVARNGDYDVFLYGVAESIENTNNGSTPINEYFDWIEQMKAIIRKMNDGHVSDSDIKLKEDFIENSFQRETEILVCLSLYEKSDNPLAKKQYDLLLLKLYRLRQLRSILQNKTKNYSDGSLLSFEERQKLQNQMMALDELEDDDQECIENGMLHQLLQQLEDNALCDIEFYRGYSFYTRMLEEQQNYDFNNTRMKMLEYLKYVENDREEQETKDMVYQRIQNLRGLEKDANQNRSSDRGFNADLFRKLRGITSRENSLK